MHWRTGLKFFCLFLSNTYTTASNCVQVIYRQKWRCTKCATKKKWLQHVSCVTRKDEEEKKRASKKRTYIHGKRKREKKEASDRMRNEQVEREMVKPCACMQRGNSCILYVRRLRFGMWGVVRYAYIMYSLWFVFFVLNIS
jgi:hypothetical protein